MNLPMQANISLITCRSFQDMTAKNFIRKKDYVSFGVMKISALPQISQDFVYTLTWFRLRFIVLIAYLFITGFLTGSLK